MSRTDKNQEDEERPNGENSLEREAYLEERKTLVEAEGEASQSFDKALITLSAGAFGLSLAFIVQIAPEPRALWYLYADTLRPDTWTEFVDKTINQKIADLKRRHRSPSESRQRLLERMGELQTKLDRTRDLYTDGDYSKEEYHEKRDAIQDQIMVVQQELSKLEDVNAGMARIDFLRHLLMSMTQGVGHTYFGYAGTARGEGKRHLVVTAYPDHPSFFTSSGETSMVERQEFYRKMNLSVRVHDDDLELEIATPAISQSEDPS